MKTKKDRQTMDKLDNCYKLVEQSSAKGGIRATEIGNKMGVHRTTAHNYLTSLELMGKVFSDQGLWKVKTGEQTIKPLEKKIVIKLPLPEKKFPDIARVKVLINELKRTNMSISAEMLETVMETFNETRTIEIVGKNVDDLDFETATNLILQANEKSSKFNLKRKLNKFKL